MTNKIFAFVGPHGSGKTMLIGQLIAMGIHYVPTYTTRPKTAVDSNELFYRFVSKEDFFKMEFIVHVTYKGHYYGLRKKDVLGTLKTHKVSAVMLDASGVKQLAKILRGNFESIFLMVDYVTLVDRMIRMGYKNDEIKYHLEYAESNNEFDNWKVCDHVIKNIHTPNTALNQAMAIMGLMRLPKVAMLRKLVG